MHTLTLSFPTLAEMHDALSKLAGRAEAAIVAAEQTAVADVKKAVPGKSKPAATPAASPAPAAAASAAAPSASAPAASAPKADAPTVDYPTLQKAVFKLAGLPEVGRAAATEVSASFGVKTFKDLPQDKWAEALAAVEAKTAELAVA